MKILHVDDLESWRDIVPCVLSEHQVVSFATLKAAKASTEVFDVYIVDGSIDAASDGLFWAYQLQKAGKKVIVLSAGNPVESISFVDKSPFDQKVLRSFLS